MLNDFYFSFSKEKYTFREPNIYLRHFSNLDQITKKDEISRDLLFAQFNKFYIKIK